MREERGERDEKLLSLSDNGDFVFGWWESEGKGEGWFIHGVLVGKGRRTGREGHVKQERREGLSFPTIVCKFRETDGAIFYFYFIFMFFMIFSLNIECNRFKESGGSTLRKSWLANSRNQWVLFQAYLSSPLYEVDINIVMVVEYLLTRRYNDCLLTVFLGCVFCFLFFF